MPTYAYACTACEHRFEIQQSFSDDSLTECPQCQGRLRKLFNTVGIVFKGSGFYRTDSRSSGSVSDTPAAPAKADGGSKASASGSSGSGSSGSSGSGSSGSPGSGSSGSGSSGSSSGGSAAKPSGSTSSAA